MPSLRCTTRRCRGLTLVEAAIAAGFVVVAAFAAIRLLQSGFASLEAVDLSRAASTLEQDTRDGILFNVLDYWLGVRLPADPGPPPVAATCNQAMNASAWNGRFNAVLPGGIRIAPLTSANANSFASLAGEASEAAQQCLAKATPIGNFDNVTYFRFCLLVTVDTGAGRSRLYENAATQAGLGTFVVFAENLRTGAATPCQNVDAGTDPYAINLYYQFLWISLTPQGSKQRKTAGYLKRPAS